MEVRFSKYFLKDLSAVHQKNISVKLQKFISFIKEKDAFSDYPNVKKLTGYQNYYRLRVGDWRVGFSYDEGIDMITFHRILPRGDIYKKFP